MKWVSTNKINDFKYELFYGDKLIGYAIQDVDGFFYYKDTNPNGGLWSAHSLKWIAECLDGLNKEWSDFIDQNLNKDESGGCN